MSERFTAILYTNGRPKPTRKYAAWRNAKARCNLNPTHKDNAWYAHVTFHRAWCDWDVFNKEFPDPPSDEHTLDRINNNLGYSPGNVRWATMAEQHRNQRGVRFIEHNGKSRTIADWARELGMAWESLAKRINKWGVEKALTTPRKRGKDNKWIA